MLRRNGSVLEITSEGDFGPSIDGFALLRNQSFDVKSLGIGKELAVRVNPPELIVDAELTAGSLTTEQIAHLGKVRVTAGGAKLNDVQQAEDVLVQTGQATLNGRFTVGRSRVRCESGSDGQPGVRIQRQRVRRGATGPDHLVRAAHRCRR